MKYFANKLPPATDVVIEYSARLTASAGVCYTKKRVIRLSTHYHLKFPEQAGVTLLHEMIHLIVPGHGKAFKAWISRINNAGGSVTMRSTERATKALYRWKYECTSCKKEYLRKKRLRGRGRHYVCGNCQCRLDEIKL